MNRLVSFSIAVCLSIAVATAATGKEAFANLSKLAGSWATTAGGPNRPSLKVTYKLTGAGSALVETLFPGEPYEMVSVYHLDGEKLVMTHYCASHNQPTLQMLATKDASDLQFEFVSGTNMKLSDMHMHKLHIQIKDANHVVSVWTPFANGKPAGSEVFDLHRVG